MIYRIAQQKDIDMIVDMRIKLLIEEGAGQPKNIESELKEYFSKSLNNDIVVVVAEDKGQIVATSTVVFQKYPPSFNNKHGIKAYITNVYTALEYRRKGISTVLMDMLIEEIKLRKVTTVWLWASKEGAHLYKKYGFKNLTKYATMDYII